MLILASASPRRRQLLQQIGITPADIISADIDETVRAKEAPAALAKRLAAEKATAVRRQSGGVVAGDDAYILAADTVVALGRRILPKAETETQARHCLAGLSGRRHRVHTAIHVIAPEGREAGRTVTSIVTFKRLSHSEISGYLATKDWLGKAGGYAIQGHAAAFVRHLSGSFSAVVGLPLYDTAQVLTGLGYNVTSGWYRD